MGENGGTNLYGMVGNDPLSSYDVLGLWTPEGVIKFLCKSDGGKFILFRLMTLFQLGWKMGTFDEVYNYDIYNDKSFDNRAIVPGVNGWTRKKLKTILLRKDPGRSDEDVAATITHESYHAVTRYTNEIPEFQAEEIQAYEQAELLAKDIGFSRNSDFWNGKNVSQEQIAALKGLQIGLALLKNLKTPPPPSAKQTTNAYSDQINRYPSPPPAGTPRKKIGRGRDEPQNEQPSPNWDIEKICPCIKSKVNSNRLLDYLSNGGT